MVQKPKQNLHIPRSHNFIFFIHRSIQKGNQKGATDCIKWVLLKFERE